MRFVSFCGAHRTGKSTLQKELCASYNALPAYMPTYTVQGDRVKSEMSLKERVSIQYEILAAYEGVLKSARTEAQDTGKEVVISDRTPIDTTAYMMADVTRSADYDLDDRIMLYIEQAQRLTIQYFHTVIYLPPGMIPLVEDLTSAQCSEAYIEHLSALCSHYLQRLAKRKLLYPPYYPRMPFHLYAMPTRFGDDFNLRAEFCKNAFQLGDFTPVREVAVDVAL